MLVITHQASYTKGMQILVTGGSGYIGSHTVLRLLEEGQEVVVIDNLVNSSRESLNRVQELTGKSVTFYEFDLCNSGKLAEVFANHDISAVIHFAGLKAVGESTQKPLLYYQNNLQSTFSLLNEMNKILG